MVGSGSGCCCWVVVVVVAAVLAVRSCVFFGLQLPNIFFFFVLPLFNMGFVPVWWSKEMFLHQCKYYSTKSEEEALRLWDASVVMAKDCRQDRRWKEDWNHDLGRFELKILFHLGLP